MERIRLSLLVGLALMCSDGSAWPRSQATASVPKESVTMTKHVTGVFDVKLAPQAQEDAGGSAARMLLDKTYHGPLEAIAKGQMLAAGTAVKNSAGYVAIELVSGTLAGHKGTFVLQHSATMNRGVPTLSITVVPDSGTEELAGLTGRMDIVIADGKHSYVFDYSLPEGGVAK